jgi:hypothetical protein
MKVLPVISWRSTESMVDFGELVNEMVMIFRILKEAGNLLQLRLALHHGIGFHFRFPVCV